MEGLFAFATMYRLVDIFPRREGRQSPGVVSSLIRSDQDTIDRAGRLVPVKVVKAFIGVMPPR
jgi:hypothetical protein